MENFTFNYNLRSLNNRFFLCNTKGEIAPEGGCNYQFSHILYSVTKNSSSPSMESLFTKVCLSSQIFIDTFFRLPALYITYCTSGLVRKCYCNCCFRTHETEQLLNFRESNQKKNGAKMHLKSTCN